MPDGPIVESVSTALIERETGAVVETVPTRRALHGAALAWSVSMAIVLGRDGSWGWILVRLMSLTVLAVLLHVALRGARGAGWAAVVAGVVGLVIGIGVGVVHAVKSGDPLLIGGGLLALIAGLVLLVRGGMLIAGGHRWWARIGSGLGIALTTGLAALTFVPAIMATNVPATDLGSETPARYGLAFDEVTFDTADGVTLSGWYVPSTNGAAVIVRHGAGSTRSDVLQHVVVLARHGYGVLAADARGHGRSGGRAMDFGWFGDADTEAGISFLLQRRDVDPSRIGAVGLSMGGEEVIGAAAADHRLRAVVAEGATGRSQSDDMWMRDVYGWRGSVQQGIGWLRTALTDVLTSADRPISLADAIERAPETRFLLIAGGEMPDERHVVDHLHALGLENVASWVVPDAGHTQGLDVAPAEWERRVLQFLDAEIGDAANA